MSWFDMLTKPSLFSLKLSPASYASLHSHNSFVQVIHLFLIYPCDLWKWRHFPSLPKYSFEQNQTQEQNIKNDHSPQELETTNTSTNQIIKLPLYHSPPLSKKIIKIIRKLPTKNPLHSVSHINSSPLCLVDILSLSEFPKSDQTLIIRILTVLIQIRSLFGVLPHQFTYALIIINDLCSFLTIDR